MRFYKAKVTAMVPLWNPKRKFRAEQRHVGRGMLWMVPGT